MWDYASAKRIDLWTIFWGMTPATNPGYNPKDIFVRVFNRREVEVEARLSSRKRKLWRACRSASSSIRSPTTKGILR